MRLTPFTTITWGLRRIAGGVGEWMRYNGVAVRLRGLGSSVEPPVSALLYHRVCGRADLAFLVRSNISSIRPGLFRTHVRCMKRAGFRFATVRAMADMVSTGRGVPAGTVALTFDDTMRDHVDTVLPILVDEGVPATFFVIAATVDSSKLLWQHRLFWYFFERGRQTCARALCAADPGAFAGLATEEILARVTREMPPDRMHDVLSRAFPELPNEEEVAAAVNLTSADLSRLSSAGMEIGSHGCGHYYMPVLSDTDYLAELVESKRVLEAALGEPVQSFSYPHNGYRDDFEMLDRSGYRVVCTVSGAHVDSNTKLHRFPRINLPNRRLSLPALRHRLLAPEGA